MKYNYVLGVDNPSVQKKMESIQFELSEILLDKRFELSLDFEMMAEIAEIEVEKYINMEYGESHIPVKNYEEAIDKIQRYELKHSKPSIQKLLDYFSDSANYTEEITRKYNYQKEKYKFSKYNSKVKFTKTDTNNRMGAA